MKAILARPRLLGFICGAGSAGVGLAYLILAGAPARFALVNLGALLLGVLAWAALGRAACSRLPGAGSAVLALALALLLTALFGLSVEGAQRWIRVGSLSLQPSLVFVPVMVVLFARRPDRIGTAGLTVAALALALQPDRAMAGALASGLVALVLCGPAPRAVLVTTVTLCAFGWTLIRPDGLPATVHVEGVLFSAFEVHPLLGVAVVLGAAALPLPALAALQLGAGERPALLAFGGCWLGVVVAADLGHYPTPVVGHGASAVLGYLLSAAMLPGGSLGWTGRQVPSGG